MSYPPPPPYGSAGYGPGPTQPVTNGKAIAALVVGVASLVLSICCLGLVGLVAVFLGIRARKEISASQGKQTGEGLAVGGIVTGALAALVSIVLIIFVVIAIAAGTNVSDYPTDTFNTHPAPRSSR